jgi:4-hydroxy-4-methyl-2-oxoglutarate aldolase
MNPNSLTQAQFEQLARLDSSAISNAIETFDVRLRNTGFTDSTVRRMCPDEVPAGAATRSPKMLGYAVTVRIRTSTPPMEGRSFDDRTDWWSDILTVPAPRIVVVEDIDHHPGLGSFIGEVHANILSAMGCVGVVTNGAVRDLPAMRAIGFHVYARNLSVSHAFAHIVDFGGPAIVGRMKVERGDLLHGDSNGVQTVPLEIASEIPAAAERILKHKQRLVSLCRSREFTLATISAAVKEVVPRETNDDGKDRKR